MKNYQFNFFLFVKEKMKNNNFLESIKPKPDELGITINKLDLNPNRSIQIRKKSSSEDYSEPKINNPSTSFSNLPVIKASESFNLNTSNTLQQDLIKYITNITDNSSFDIVFMLHDFDFNNSLIFNIINDKIKSNPKLRITFGVWTINKTNHYYACRMHKFDEGFSANNSTHYKNLLEFRNDLLNLNWKSNNIKIAVNVMKESVKNSVIDFVYSNDDLKKLLDKKNINMRLLKVTDNMLTTNEGILNEIFNFDYLLKLSTEESKITMHKELFFCKRFQFKTFDEFKSERNKLFIEKNLAKLLKQNIQVEFESYEKKGNYDSKIELKVKESAKLRLLDVTESVNNLYLFDGDLIFTKTNKSRQVWIEAFENEESVDRLLDISLSLNGLISLFCKTSNCSMSQPKVFKLKSRGLFFFWTRNQLEHTKGKFNSFH